MKLIVSSSNSSAHHESGRGHTIHISKSPLLVMIGQTELELLADGRHQTWMQFSRPTLRQNGEMDIKENPVKHMDVVDADRCRPSDLAYDTMLWLCCCKAGMGHDNIQQIILENGPPALDAFKFWNIPTKARSR